MSLINQMLQDLAQRQAPLADTLNQISAIPVQARPKKIPVWIWLGLVCLISVNALAWLWWHNQPNTPQPVRPAVMKRTIQPAVSAAAKPAPAAIIPQLAASPTPPPVATEPQPAPAGTAPTLTPSLTLSLPITRPNPSALPGKPAMPNEPAQNTPTSISKQLKPLTSAQLAENEYRKALTLAQQGHINESIDNFGQALALDPHHHAARLTLVGLLIENKRMAEAERRLQEGIALDADQTDLAMILARLQVERGSITDGIATLERSLPYASEQADYQAFLAALLQRGGRHKSAIEHYIVALKQSPQSGVWWMGLGISLKADNQPDKAREAFTRAKASNSLSPELLAFVNQQLS